MTLGYCKRQLSYLLRGFNPQQGGPQIPPLFATGENHPPSLLRAEGGKVPAAAPEAAPKPIAPFAKGGWHFARRNDGGIR